MTFLRSTAFDLQSYHRNAGWFLIWGMALVALGALAISAATFTTLLSVILLGFLIALCGGVIIIDTITFWWGFWSGFFLHLLVGLLYAFVGIMMITTPAFSSVSLTLLLGIFYTLIGLARLGFSTSMRLPKWRWGFFNGLVTLLLGILILLNWPASSLYIIGIFVGIDILFSGMAYIMAALSARRAP